jgi:hypothetical protein
MRAATLPLAVAGRLRSSFRAHAKSEERARHGALPGADSSLIARATGGSGGASPSAGTHGLGGPYPDRAAHLRPSGPLPAAQAGRWRAAGRRRALAAPCQWSTAASLSVRWRGDSPGGPGSPRFQRAQPEGPLAAWPRATGIMSLRAAAAAPLPWHGAPGHPL